MYFLKKRMIMKNVKVFYLALAGLVAVAPLSAIVNGGIKSVFGCIGNCLGDVNTQGLGAAGDVRSIDTAKVTFKSLGTISATKIINITTPTKNNYTGYSITFASGELANKQIQFIGMYELEAGENVYKFYRKLSTDKLWTEVGTLNAAQSVTQDICSSNSETALWYLLW